MQSRYLRTIARLVTPRGYLFEAGIDLDIHTKVAKGLGWNPVQELLEEIHEGDPAWTATGRSITWAWNP